MEKEDRNTSKIEGSCPMGKELDAIFEDFVAEEETAQSNVHPAHSEVRGKESIDADPGPIT